MAKCSYKLCPGLSDSIVLCSNCGTVRYHNHCAMKDKCSICFDETGNVVYCQKCQRRTLSVANSTAIELNNANFLNLCIIIVIF